MEKHSGHSAISCRIFELGFEGLLMGFLNDETIEGKLVKEGEEKEKT